MWLNGEWQRITAPPFLMYYQLKESKKMKKSQGINVLLFRPHPTSPDSGEEGYRQLVTPSVVAMAVRTDITIWMMSFQDSRLNIVFRF